VEGADAAEEAGAGEAAGPEGGALFTSLEGEEASDIDRTRFRIRLPGTTRETIRTGIGTV
jgi:hypothetical protein